jgi:hypothetical protein
MTRTLFPGLPLVVVAAILIISFWLEAAGAVIRVVIWFASALLVVVIGLRKQTSNASRFPADLSLALAGVTYLATRDLYDLMAMQQNWLTSTALGLMLVAGFILLLVAGKRLLTEQRRKSSPRSEK